MSEYSRTVQISLLKVRLGRNINLSNTTFYTHPKTMNEIPVSTHFLNEISLPEQGRLHNPNHHS